MGQRTAKVQAVKVGGLKKILPAGPPQTKRVRPGARDPYDWMILKAWRTVTLKPFDLQRQLVPL